MQKRKKCQQIHGRKTGKTKKKRALVNPLKNPLRGDFEKRVKSGEIYNIGAGNEINNLDLVKQILSILQQDENLISFVKDRKGHDRRYSVNAQKLMGLGWQPQTPFEKGLVDTVLWYKK